MASQLRLRRSISTLTFSSKQPVRRWTLLTWIPLLVLHSPSRTTSTVSLLVLGSLTIVHPRPQTSSRGFCFPSDVPRARSPLPRKLSSPRLASATANSLRRGIPSPLRFAYTVFHGLDDLLLLAPCDIFQPLTPVGFFIPFPALLRGTTGKKLTLTTTKRPTREVGLSGNQDHLSRPGVGTLARSSRVTVDPLY